MVDSNQFVTDLTTIGGGTAHMIGYAQNAGAGYIEAPNNTQQADGVVPLDRLPAQWWNWFLNQATRRFSEYETYVENIVAELDGVLDILGITPDAGDPSTVNQLKTMFASHYLQDYLPEVIAAASSFSADATHENHILVADDDGNSGYSVKKVPYAPGFILNTQLSSAAKTLTLPANCPFDGQTIKICFANGHEAANSSDVMTLNVNSTGPVPIVSNQNGTLANLPIHELTAGTYSVLMANVTLEMYYTSNGFNSNPAWVVIGNPVVLSSTDYTIYADGQTSYNAPAILERGVITPFTLNASTGTVSEVTLSRTYKLANNINFQITPVSYTDQNFTIASGHWGAQGTSSESLTQTNKLTIGFTNLYPDGAQKVGAYWAIIGTKNNLI